MPNLTSTEITQMLESLTAPTAFPTAGGLQFRDVKAALATVTDNGVDADDPRVIDRANSATKIVLDAMIPVGGMATALITASETVLALPPQMENAIEAFPADPATKVRGSTDIAHSWCEIVSNTAYLDPEQQHDNPLIDLGLWPAPWDGYEGKLVRLYSYPGLQPDNANVWVTGTRRFIPVVNDDDYMIVQNVEALKSIILYIERKENSAVDDAPKYLKDGMDLLQAEVRKHLLDPRNYMRRKAAYYDDVVTFPENSLGWIRANLAIDLPDALRMGKRDLTWAINQVERRIMQSGIYKDTIIEVRAEVVGGFVYFPINVQGVLAVDLSGRPIPIRNQFFPYLDNGPGQFPVTEMLIDQGQEYLPNTKTQRRKYKLNASTTSTQTLTAVCKLRWVFKEPGDIMTIKNYEVYRLLMSAKFLEEKQDWNNARSNEQQAYAILERELKDYLAGIKHTVHIQTYGFGLGDVGNYWRR